MPSSGLYSYNYPKRRDLEEENNLTRQVRKKQMRIQDRTEDRWKRATLNRTDKWTGKNRTGEIEEEREKQDRIRSDRIGQKEEDRTK